MTIDRTNCGHTLRSVNSAPSTEDAVIPTQRKRRVAAQADDYRSPRHSESVVNGSDNAEASVTKARFSSLLTESK